MTVCVFVGPSLPPAEARQALDAEYLPPVAQGDVYRAAMRRPRAIGIIDGYFERMPAVWHKEILWALAQGIHVYGSASMGALRAAELAPFGMVGVGQVYEAYRDNVLEDDDEVAVAHGPAESGYRGHSEAMVNIRSTLAAAAAAGIIAAETRVALERLAKSLYYADRNYPRVLQLAAQQALPADELAALRAWLPRGRVDQKRLDALTMLRTMRERLAAQPDPKEVGFRFEYTGYWDEVTRLATPEAAATATPDPLTLDALLEELRLDGDAYERAHDGAMLRHLALAEARRHGWAATPEATRWTAAQFRRTHELRDATTLAHWLEDNQLTEAQFAALMSEQTLVQRVREQVAPDALNGLVDQLRLDGRYAALRARARDKQHTLEAAGLDNPGLADTGLSWEALLTWYFEERLRRPVPDNLAQYLSAAGFLDEADFLRAVVRDRCSQSLSSPEAVKGSAPN